MHNPKKCLRVLDYRYYPLSLQLEKVIISNSRVIDTLLVDNGLNLSPSTILPDVNRPFANPLTYLGEALMRTWICWFRADEKSSGPAGKESARMGVPSASTEREAMPTEAMRKTSSVEG